MRALIDGDIVSFSCAVFNESHGLSWEAVREDIDNMMKRILETTGVNEYSCYISGDSNFRREVDPTYKANRKDKPQPRYRQDANAYLVTEYGARVTEGIEADDALGIEQCQAEDGTTIIASIDKDLLTIPGHHYNWRKNEFTFVTPVDALRRFYCSFLTGDTADNIIGVRGIGPVKSGRLINHLENEIDMFEVVQVMYNDDERLLRNGKLLYIHQREQDDWAFPFIHLREQVVLLSSQISSQEQNDPTLDTM